MSIRARRAATTAIIATALGFVAAGHAQETPPPPSAPAEPPLDPQIDRILTRLEARKVDDLIADVKWSQAFAIEKEDESDTKVGTIRYMALKPTAKFIIHFRDKIGDGRRNAINETFAFDGCWYWEIKPRAKMVVKYEVRKPDDPHDPYKIGEGIFPLPFGQKKDEILREFTIERRDPGKDDPADTDHLVMTPRPNTRLARLYKTLDFWIARKGELDGLPVQVRVAKLDGTMKVNNRISISFSNVKLNTRFDPKEFELKVPDGYQVETNPLRPESPAMGAEPPAKVDAP